MKKKGFTLLELLAVMVVVAIIAVVVTPLVANAIRRARKESFKNSAYGIISSAELYYGEKMVKQDFSSTLIRIKDEEPNPEDFKYKGDKVKKGYVEIDETGKIKMYAWNSGFCAKKDFNEAEVEITEDKQDECTLDGPKNPIVKSDTNEWTSGEVTISIEEDEGIRKYQYNISEDPNSYDSSKWVDIEELPLKITEELIPEDGEYYIFIRGVDEEGAGEVSRIKVQIDRKEQNLVIADKEGAKLTKDKETYKIGEKVILNLDLEPGYELKKIEGTGVEITKEDDGTYSFIMKKGPIEINYELERLEFNIELEQSIGGIIATKQTKYFYGEEVEVATIATTGYRLKSLTYNDGENHDITSTKKFTMGEKHVKIKVEWEHITYEITVPTLVGGTIVPNKTTAYYNDEIVLTVNPATGYHLNTLTYNDGTDHDIKTTKKFTMPAKNVEIGGSFSKTEYTITVPTTVGGTFKANKTTAYYGDEIIITATPSTGYKLKVLSYNDGTSHDITSTKKFTMPDKNVAISGSYVKIDYTVTLAQTTGGVIATSKNTYNYQDEIVVGVSPSTGYRLKSLVYNDGEDHDITSTKKFTLGTVGVTIRAEWEKIPYAITVTNTTGGTFTVSKTTAYYGDEITITSTAATGYQLSTLKYNDGSDHDVKSAKKFTMPAKNVTVTGTWSKIPYTITVTNTTGGTFKVSKTTAYYGDAITITTTASTGYQLSTLKYNDGSDHDVKSAKKFTMPAKNVTVTGTWSKIQYTVTVTNTTGGTFTVNKTKAYYGDSITVSASAATGYQLSTITYNGTNITSAKSFKMPAGNVTVTGTWSKIPYTVTVVNTTGGTFGVSKTTAYYGDTITVSASPAANYALSSITYNGNNITSAKSFTMPAGNVTVTGSWYLTTITKYRTRSWVSQTCQGNVYTPHNVCSCGGHFVCEGGCGCGVDQQQPYKGYGCSTVDAGGSYNTYDCSHWGDWGSWTTTWCSASDSCQVATCLASSPSGQCYSA